MASKSVIKVLIDGDSKGLTSELSKADGKIGAFAKNTAKSFAVMGAAVIAGGVIIGKKLIEAGEAASTSNARITQVATSMGLFGDKVDAVSGRLVNYANKTALATGVDQNAIKMTQAKLLTFAALAETADKAGGAFDRATAAAIDMAAAGFGTAEGNAVQLGKALNDPVKGIMALTKSGITFTAAEKEKIKTLVESGKMGEAQAMILAAIETQVGGTAAATANASDKMKVAFSQLQERLGLKLLPVFEKLSRFFIERLIPAFERIAAKWGPILGDTFSTISRTVQTLGEKIGRWLQPMLERVGAWMSANTDTVKVFFGVVIGAVAVGAVLALGAALGALLSPAVLITAGIAALVAGIQYAYTNFDGFRNVVDSVGRFFRDDFLPVVQRVFAWLKVNIPAAIEVIRSKIQSFISAVRVAWSRWGDEIMAVVTRAWGFIRTSVENAINAVRGIIQMVTSFIRGDWSGVWDGLKQILSGAWEQIKNVVRFGIDAVVALVRGIGPLVARAASGAFEGVKGAFRAAINWIIDKWNGLEFRVPGIEVLGRTVVPGITIGTPNIPRLADGGIIPATPGGRLALIGEGGQDEAVIPLNKLNKLGGGSPVIVNIYPKTMPTLRELTDLVNEARRRGLAI
jgi:hypothetical protein